MNRCVHCWAGSGSASGGDGPDPVGDPSQSLAFDSVDPYLASRSELLSSREDPHAAAAGLTRPDNTCPRGRAPPVEGRWQVLGDIRCNVTLHTERGYVAGTAGHSDTSVRRLACPPPGTDAALPPNSRSLTVMSTPAVAKQSVRTTRLQGRGAPTLQQTMCTLPHRHRPSGRPAARHLLRDALTPPLAVAACVHCGCLK